MPGRSPYRTIGNLIGMFNYNLDDQTIDVLLRLAEGQSLGYIAAALDLNDANLKTQIRGLRQEWGAPNNVALIAQAYHRGVLKVPSQ